MPDNVTTTATDGPSGAILPTRVRRVNQTGTTATGIVALYLK